jgi:hypothetical protein
MKKIIQGKSLVFDQSTGTVDVYPEDQNYDSETSDKGCILHFVVHDDGTTEGPDCLKDGEDCQGTCTLREKIVAPGKTKYWCSCS